MIWLPPKRRLALPRRQRGLLLNPFRFGVSDPFYANTVLICNGQGSNASTVLTDSSLYNRTSTAFGNAQLSTTAPIYGVSSPLLDGNGDSWSFPNSGDFDFGSGLFTVEGYAIANVNNATKRMAGSRFANPLTQGLEISTNSTGKLQMTGYNNDAFPFNVIGATTITTGVVFHWAFAFDGTTFRAFLNGTVDGTQTPVGLIGTSGGAFYVGATPIGQSLAPTTNFDGKLIIRVTKGVCRYTANFTPDYTLFPTS